MQPENFTLESHRGNWPFVINCPDHFTSTNPVSISSRGANISSAEGVLRWSCGAGKFNQGGTFLVDGKLTETLQCKKNSPARTPNNLSDTDASTKCWVHTTRKFRQGVMMVKEGEAFSHKCSTVTGIKIYNPNFHKEFVTFDHSCSGGQQSCSSISLEDGWHPQSTAFKNLQVNLELSSISSDHNYFKVLFIWVECQHWGSRNATDLSDWKLHQKVFLKITKLLGTPTVDLFPSRLCHQLPQYMAWKPDPSSFATDAMQQDWNKMFGFASPPLRLMSSDKEASLGKCRSNDTSDTHIAGTTLAYSPTKNVPTMPAFASTTKPITINLLGEEHHLVKIRSPRFSGVESYRETLEM